MAYFRLGPGLGLALFVALCALTGADSASAQALTPGDIYVSDPNAFAGAGGVIKINPTTGAQTAVSQGGLFVDPVYLAVSAAGDLFVVDSASQGSGAVIRVNPSTGAQTLVSSGGLLDGPAGIAIGANGDLFLTNGLCGCNPPDILRINPISGAQSVLTSGDRLLFGGRGAS